MGVVSDGVGEDVGAVEADVEDGEGRGRHCAGVTAIWEVTDRDDRLSQLQLPPTLHPLSSRARTTSLDAPSLNRRLLVVRLRKRLPKFQCHRLAPNGAQNMHSNISHSSVKL